MGERSDIAETERDLSVSMVKKDFEGKWSYFHRKIHIV